MGQNDWESLLEQKEELRSLVYPRGFFMTNDPTVHAQAHPFYGLWNRFEQFGYTFYVHPKQKIYIFSDEKLGLVLIGHAFDPVSESGEYREEKLLAHAAEQYAQSETAFTEYFNRWTGLFALFVFTETGLRIYGDAAGMYTVFYGLHNDYVYCASHTGLFGDICRVSFNPYIDRLIHYKFYPLFGKALPGDLSPYSEFKRLIPNHYALYSNGAWTVSRFFPTADNALFSLSYQEIVTRAGEILSESMRLIPQKWNRCAISLTGGCDSKTTLSCANGSYDKYSYFSYISSDSEAVDAEAAAQICKLLHLPHKIYKISESDADYEDIDALKCIMEHNSGCIGANNANDIRKRAFFLGIDDFDVEVKSWVSEIARAYYHKRFAKTKFPKTLTPRYATCLYKVFLQDRKLVRDTDRVFAEFLQKYYLPQDFERIPWYDLFFWEFRMSSWNGLVITGEQQIAFDIVIPYNNRVLLQLMLSTPVEKRIADEVHKDIMRQRNVQISDCGISVVNVKHTEKRAKLERLYLNAASKIPF